MLLFVHLDACGRWNALSSRHLRALLSVCGRCSFGDLGCCSGRVRVSGVLFSVGVCVCVTCWSFYLDVCVCFLLCRTSTPTWRSPPSASRRPSSRPTSPSTASSSTCSPIRCVHSYIYIYIYTYIHEYVGIYIYRYRSIDLYKYVSRPTSPSTASSSTCSPIRCVHSYIHIHIYIYTYIYIFTHTHIYIYIYIYIYTYIHIYIYI